MPSKQANEMKHWQRDVFGILKHRFNHIGIFFSHMVTFSSLPLFCLATKRASTLRASSITTPVIYEHIHSSIWRHKTRFFCGQSKYRMRQGERTPSENIREQYHLPTLYTGKFLLLKRLLGLQVRINALLMRGLSSWLLNQCHPNQVCFSRQI